MNNRPDRRTLRTWYPASWACFCGSHFRRQMLPRLQRRQRSCGKRFNYLSKSLSGNFAEMTASSPFTYMSVATNLRQGIDSDIKDIC